MHSNIRLHETIQTTTFFGAVACSNDNFNSCFTVIVLLFYNHFFKQPEIECVGNEDYCSAKNAYTTDHKFVAADSIAGLTTGAPIELLIDSFTNLQHTLLYGDTSIDIAPLKIKFINDYNKLDVEYLNFFKQLNSNISYGVSANFISLLNAENCYIQQLDDFSSKLTGYSNDEVKFFQWKEICILCCSIVIIFIELRFIFSPTIKKIEN